MTTEDKIALLNRYDDKPTLTSEDCAVLSTMAADSDSLVRSMTAELLVKCINDEGKRILLVLAADKDPFVRADAIDSLSVFSYMDVLSFLRRSLETEPDELARSYAILSWTDVALSIYHDKMKILAIIQDISQREHSDSCLLSCYYAMVLVGDTKALNKMMQFLKSPNYLIRCSTINLLEDIVNEKNKEQIREEILQLFETETTAAVKDCAAALLRRLQ